MVGQYYLGFYRSWMERTFIHSRDFSFRKYPPPDNAVGGALNEPVKNLKIMDQHQAETGMAVLFITGIIIGLLLGWVGFAN